MQSHIKISGEKLGNKGTPRRVLSLWFKNNKTKKTTKKNPTTHNNTTTTKGHLCQQLLVVAVQKDVQDRITS